MVMVSFFDRDCYAQTIADYMMNIGTGRTRSGNYHFEFSEINESFGIDLPSDSDMLDKIVSSLDSEIVSDVDTTEDFDLMFYLKYCPYAESDEEMEESETNSDMTID